METFDILGDPVRRRILEQLAGGEASAGELVEAIRGEFGISQPAVSQHLRVLREGGLVLVRAEAQKRFYSLQPDPFAGIERWLAGFRQPETKDGPGKKARKGDKKKRKKHKAALAHLPKVPKRRKAKR